MTAAEKLDARSRGLREMKNYGSFVNYLNAARRTNLSHLRII